MGLGGELNQNDLSSPREGIILEEEVTSGDQFGFEFDHLIYLLPTCETSGNIWGKLGILDHIFVQAASALRRLTRSHNVLTVFDYACA